MEEIEAAESAEAPELHVSSPVMILGGPSLAASALTRRLRGADVKVLHAPNPTIAAKSAREDQPRLVVADLRSSRRVENAEGVLAGMRQATEQIAVLFWLDADDNDAPQEGSAGAHVGIEETSGEAGGEKPAAGLHQQVLQLSGPLDDFSTGSVDPEESMLRLHLLTSRLPALREGERLVVGDLELDARRRTVTRAGADIDLSATELKLLRLLMRHSRTVLSKSEILHEVWEYEFAGQANIVELYISYLRKKIEAGMPKMIHTVRGAGYVLRPAEESQEERVTEE